MKKLFVLFCIITSALLLTECKKYPEGPSISFRTKKARIINSWKVSKYLENNVDLTTNFNSVFTNFSFITSKDGEYKIIKVVRVFSTNVTTTEYGNWNLASNKKTLNLTPVSISSGTLPSSSSCQILKLFEDEMWLRIIDSTGKIIEYHLVSA
jgi:hypothetical protein